MIRAIHHVQLAMPEGGEDAARAFYGDVLGIAEREKPEDLKANGGCWFESGDLRVHLGVETDFLPARKAHPAFITSDLNVLTHRLLSCAITFESADPIDGCARIFCDDPFGNRIEFME